MDCEMSMTVSFLMIAWWCNMDCEMSLVMSLVCNYTLLMNAVHTMRRSQSKLEITSLIWYR